MFFLYLFFMSLLYMSMIFYASATEKLLPKERQDCQHMAAATRDPAYRRGARYAYEIILISVFLVSYLYFVLQQHNILPSIPRCWARERKKEVLTAAENSARF